MLFLSSDINWYFQCLKVSICSLQELGIQSYWSKDLRHSEDMDGVGEQILWQFQVHCVSQKEIWQDSGNSIQKFNSIQCCVFSDTLWVLKFRLISEILLMPLKSRSHSEPVLAITWHTWGAAAAERVQLELQWDRAAGGQSWLNAKHSAKQPRWCWHGPEVAVKCGMLCAALCPHWTLLPCADKQLRRS